MSNRPRIVFLVPYPQATVGSQRFRFEQYIELLRKNGFQVKQLPFFSSSRYAKVNSRINPVTRMWLLSLSFIERFVALREVRQASFVFIHREATPVGPPVIEWIIARILRKKIIFDFDDAIWLTDNVREARMASLLRWRHKVASICSYSYRISCGNTYLAAYATQFNARVTINPTTLDTVNLHNPLLYTSIKKSEPVTIGWTGTHSTLKYLQMLEPVFKDLLKRHPHLCFMVIADRKPERHVEALKFVRWNKVTEMEDLLAFDIGVMPLPDDAWSKGKCGFKALQYMAMEIPCVASPVGVNTEIIEHGKNGYLAESQEQWTEWLDVLIRDKELRESMGKAGRQKVIDYYSVLSNQSNFFSLFE